MKKMTTTLSALTIAAALMMNLTACTTDDIIAATTEQPTEPQKIHVTVGAGLGDGDGTTRAAVDDSQTDANGKPIRTLKFTTGDRLYVTEHLGGSPMKYLAGYLDMVGSPSADGTSASFSGDLGVYLGDGTTSSYDFGVADPLTVDVTEARLVPAASPAGFEIGTIPFIYINEAKMIATDVNTLMASAMYVSGMYTSSSKSFSLSDTKPILNCTIGNLKKNTEYSVKLRVADNQSDYESGNYISVTTYDAMTVTSDANGVAKFAISGLTGNHENVSYNFYYELQLIPTGSGSTKTYVLGQKALRATVYNVNRDLYGTCRLTVQMPLAPGTIYYEQCDAFTVKLGDEIIYQSPSGSLWTYTNGQTGFQFTMEPVTNATLTVIGTKNTGSGTVTYSGTATGVTTIPSQITNVGPVTMRKGKDLSAGSITADDGDVICQSSESTNHTITIPDGVTVTLAGVNISVGFEAGIICQGSANIILSGSNSVQGRDNYPAVQAGPTGKTLTISGSGSLTATGGSGHPGIGSGNNGNCGNITISGGNITATGGIGAAGIGGGHNGSCGAITISGGSGTATKGAAALNSIGCGGRGTCGTITIYGVDYGTSGIVVSPFTWPTP